MKAENDAPIAGYLHTPKAFQLPFERVKVVARLIEVLGFDGDIEERKDIFDRLEQECLPSVTERFNGSRQAFLIDPETPIVTKRLYLATGEIEEYIVTRERRLEAWNWAQTTARKAEAFEQAFLAGQAEAEPNVTRL